MDEVMNAFVERQNIVHYIELLKTEADPAKRATVVRLLAEETAKQKKSLSLRKSKLSLSFSQANLLQAWRGRAA